MKLFNLSRTLLASALLILLSATIPAHAEDLVFQPVQIAGADYTEAFCLNNQGYLVGAYSMGGVQQGYLSADGALTPIKFPGSVLTFPYGVNASKTVSGTFVDASLISHAFIWKNGVFTELVPTPSNGPVTSASAFQLNDAGRVVGYYTDSGGQHGFFWQNGIFTTLRDVVKHRKPLVYGVNNVDVMTVQAMEKRGDPETNDDSYYLIDSFLHFAPVIGNSSYIHGLNTSNTAVSSFSDLSGAFHGAVNIKGRGQVNGFNLYFIDYPRSSLQTYLNSITESNLIAGNTLALDGTYMGFIVRFKSAPRVILPPAFNLTPQVTSGRPTVDAPPDSDLEIRQGATGLTFELN